MLYETNYFSNIKPSNTSSNLIASPNASLDSKIESNNKKDLQLRKSNSKLENILNSIQRDTIEYDSQYESTKGKQNDYLSSSSSCSSFSVSSSPLTTSQHSPLPNLDEISIHQRNEYLNSSGTSSYNGLIIDPSISEQKTQFNYFSNHQNSLISPNMIQESSSSNYQYNDNQISYYSNDWNIQQQTGENFTFSPIITSLPSNTFPAYSHATVNISSVSEQQNYHSNQIIDNYNQNYYLLSQNNNSNFYTNEPYNQPLTSYYPHQQVNHHLSHQLCYSNETNSLVFNMTSNNSLEDLESSSLTDSDDDLNSESNEDLGLNYKMEANNFILNQKNQNLSDQQHQIEKIDNRKAPKSNSNKKIYQKKKSKSGSNQQHLIISSSVTNSNMMTGLSNLTTSTNKRKRKRILNRLQRAEATMREKRRMLKLNKAFEELRKVLPISEFAKNKLSRAETLKSAIEYIEKMSEILSI